MFAKQRVMEAGLPGHVVHTYLDQSTDRLTQRMKNIVRNALRSPQTATPSTSTAIDATSTLIANKMQYAKRISPNERRVEAVKRKLNGERISCVIVKQRGVRGSRFKEEEEEEQKI